MTIAGADPWVATFCCRRVRSCHSQVSPCQIPHRHVRTWAPQSRLRHSVRGARRPSLQSAVLLCPAVKNGPCPKRKWKARIVQWAWCSTRILEQCTHVRVVGLDAPPLADFRVGDARSGFRDNGAACSPTPFALVV